MVEEIFGQPPIFSKEMNMLTVSCLPRAQPYYLSSKDFNESFSKDFAWSEP
jgi:hypothetical protein